MAQIKFKALAIENNHLRWQDLTTGLEDKIALYGGLKYEEQIFVENTIGTCKAINNPFDAAKVFYTDIEINGMLYLSASDTKNIIAFKNNNKNNTAPLNVPGDYEILITKIDYGPESSRKVGFQYKKFNYPGFRFSYSFKDNFAAPSHFFLPVIVDIENGIEADKVSASIEKLLYLAAQANLDVEEVKKTLIGENLEKSKLQEFIDNLLANGPLTSIISAFYNQEQKFIIHFNPTKKTKNLNINVNKEHQGQSWQPEAKHQPEQMMQAASDASTNVDDGNPKTNQKVSKAPKQNSTTESNPKQNFEIAESFKPIEISDEEIAAHQSETSVTFDSKAEVVLNTEVQDNGAKLSQDDLFNDSEFDALGENDDN